MLPGKSFTPEDILQIARKRIWWILVPFAIVSAVTAVVARRLPNVYRSEAFIMVVPQRVPESFVRSTVTARVEDRLVSIMNSVLTRTQLEQIILELNLYQKERRNGIMQDIVERMRTVDIQTRVERGDAFRVSYIGGDPRLVLAVTEKLATAFVNENVRNRGNLAEGTSQFLEASLEEARQNLKAQEEKMADFRRKYSGELPSQMESNIQRQGSVESQIQALTEALNDDRDRRLLLEKAIADLEQESADVPVSQTAAAATTPELSTIAQRLAAARRALADLEKKFLPGAPEVRRMKIEVQDLEEQLKAEPATAAATPDRAAAPATSPNERSRQTRVSQLRGELAQVIRKIAENEKEVQQLRTVATKLQARVEAVPSRETELAELNRGYQSLQLIFETRFKNLEDAKTAANLERRQIGEQFQMLEPARLPERPFSPNRQALNLMGLVAGLVAGLAMVALIEYRDKSFKSDEDIVRVLTLPVLAVVPLMQSAQEKQKTWRLHLLLSIGLGTVVATCLGVVAYTLLR